MDYHYKGDDALDFGHLSIDSDSVALADRAYDLLMLHNASGQYHESDGFPVARQVLLNAIYHGLLRTNYPDPADLDKTTCWINAAAIYEMGPCDNGESVEYNLTRVFGVKVVVSTDKVEAAHRYVAKTYGQGLADHLKATQPQALTLIADGWTPENAYAHLEGTCDRAICMGEH